MNINNLVEAIIPPYINNPVHWINHFIEFNKIGSDGLSKNQEDIANKLATYKQINVIEECGKGKTAITAMLILWFLSTRAYSKVPVTAPNYTQLHDCVFREIEKWLIVCKLEKLFTMTKGLLRVNYSQDWFCTARSCILQEHCFAGFCANHIMYVADEAEHVQPEALRYLNNVINLEDTYILLVSSGSTYSTRLL